MFTPDEEKILENAIKLLLWTAGFTAFMAMLAFAAYLEV